jgi:glutathione S-transferase
MMLEEKKIPYTVEKINMRCYGDKPDSFLQKVPRGLLPVVELDGKIITESSEIMSTLEREFPEAPLMPPAGTPVHKCGSLSCAALCSTLHAAALHFRC